MTSSVSLPYLLDVVFAHDLGSLDSIHLLCPSCSWLELPDRADLVQAVTRYANVVVSLQNNLDIANVERRVWTNFCKSTRGSDDIVDKVVSQCENSLE